MKLVRFASLRCFLSLCLLILTLRLASTALAQEPAAVKYPPTVVFMTDFGTLDDSVAICKGVMYQIAPDVRIVDLTHQVTPFSVSEGAGFLYGATPYYPAGTVFVVVVDPGVGTSRKAIVAKSKRGQFFVLPDNGLLTLVADRDGIEAVREISNISWMLGSTLSSTFHGRDIFSPVGARIARGDDWTRVGPEIPPEQIIRLELKSVRADGRGLSGEIIATDGPFGNLVTNISADDFLKLGYQRGQRVPITIGRRSMTIKFVKTFGDVPRNSPLLYIDSRGRVGLAVNQGNFSAIYGIKPPQSIFIPRAGR
jgi:S-adenosylmethionine hydrolase